MCLTAFVLAETIRKAREEVMRRREAARQSTDSLNSRNSGGGGVSSSVTSMPGVSVSQSVERMAGLRGSVTSAFSYGTHDSGVSNCC